MSFRLFIDKRHKEHLTNKLVKAAREGNKEEVQACLADGAKPNWFSLSHGQLALTEAIKNIHTNQESRKIAHLLLDNNADPNLLPPYDTNAYKIKTWQTDPAILMAAHMPDCKMFDLLLAHEAKITSTKENWTCLMAACDAGGLGSVKIARKLLEEHDVDVNDRRCDGCTGM